MWVVFGGLLLGASVSDMRYMRVSNKYWALILLLSLLELLVLRNRHILEYAKGLMAISVPLCALNMFVPGSFGGADIKMMAVCGALLGARLIVLSFVGGVFLAGGVCMAGRIAGRQRACIPLIPFFSLGVVIAVLFEKELAHYIFFPT